MDKSRGAVATLLVQRGTLHIGDLVVAGSAQAQSSAVYDRGRRVKDAPPSFRSKSSASRAFHPLAIASWPCPTSAPHER